MGNNIKYMCPWNGSFFEPAFVFLMSVYSIVRGYINAGYTNKEICALLCSLHSICISVRTLKRKRRRFGLRRRRWTANNTRLTEALREELRGSGSCLGYRGMTLRLRTVHGLVVPRDIVMEMLREIDPQRVLERRTARFTRRVYNSKGPNYLVHLDGYDKIKPYGFAIHGAICGFSRKILWLKVGRTNNDPYVVADYFMDFVENIQAVPRCLRIDRGTENVFIEDIPKAFRWDQLDIMAGERSVISGSSIRNQRIERWWLTLRQYGVGFWINRFKDMESLGVLETDNPLHIECLRFCLTELIQSELDQIVKEWNQHRVSCRSHSEGSISGIPNLLYDLPHVYGTVDYKVPVRPLDIQQIQSMCTKSRLSGCEEDFENVYMRKLQTHGKSKPIAVDEALVLFQWLVHQLSV